MADENFDAGFEKPASSMWKPGKIGNVLKGVLTGSKPFDGDYGPTTAYEIKGIAGSFNPISRNKETAEDVVSEQATDVKPGEMYVVIERSTFADDIKKAKVGQQILLRFVEWRTPKKGGKPYKYVECKLGPMDPTYAAENAGAAGAVDPEFK